jgi:hypothetical protein
MGLRIRWEFDYEFGSLVVPYGKTLPLVFAVVCGTLGCKYFRLAGNPAPIGNCDLQNYLLTHSMEQSPS